MESGTALVWDPILRVPCRTVGAPGFAFVHTFPSLTASRPTFSALQEKPEKTWKLRKTKES